MKRYQVVFFDLDHTLWDFDRNSLETLTELFQQHDLNQLDGLSFDAFYEAFRQVNTRLWDLYDRGQLDRDIIRHKRFNFVFEHVNIQNETLAGKLAADYLTLSPTKKNLIEGAIEMLDYLRPRYPLYLITNGFTEMQTTKARSGGIEPFFRSIITSERAGHKKPAKEIFDFALGMSGFGAADAIMIGDNMLTDMAGAIGAGIDTVHFYPNSPHPPPEGGLPTPEIDEKITHRISKLSELLHIL